MDQAHTTRGTFLADHRTFHGRTVLVGLTRKNQVVQRRAAQVRVRTPFAGSRQSNPFRLLGVGQLIYRCLLLKVGMMRSCFHAVTIRDLRSFLDPQTQLESACNGNCRIPACSSLNAVTHFWGNFISASFALAAQGSWATHKGLFPHANNSAGARRSSAGCLSTRRRVGLKPRRVCDGF